MATATKKQVIHEIAIKHITEDGELQPRGTIDTDVVHEYSEAILNGDEFPPLSVYFDGVTYWLADRYHRYRASVKAGKPSVRCVVYQGGKDDAMLYSLGANATHGMRRTHADKRRAILKMLDHAEWCLWSDAEIARRCRVHSSTVSRYRQNSPGVLGYDVNLRVDRNGKLQDNGSTKGRTATIEPSPRFNLPPTPLSKLELGDQYARKIVRALKVVDSQVKARVETPYGTADAVDSSHAYILATAGDRQPLFAAIGRALLIAHFLGKKPAIIGHFSRSVAVVVNGAKAVGFKICSPETLIMESEVG